MFILVCSVLNNINDIRRELGYCPQFDALDGFLTTREMLSFYARLRGVSWKDAEKVNLFWYYVLHPWIRSRMMMIIYSLAANIKGHLDCRFHYTFPFIKHTQLSNFDENPTRFYWPNDFRVLNRIGNRKHRLCGRKSILTGKEIKTNYIPYTCTMLTTNCNNFEMFEFPYCLLNSDSPPHPLTTPQIYAF